MCMNDLRTVIAYRGVEVMLQSTVSQVTECVEQSRRLDAALTYLINYLLTCLLTYLNSLSHSNVVGLWRRINQPDYEMGISRFRGGGHEGVSCYYSNVVAY